MAVATRSNMPSTEKRVYIVRGRPVLVDVRPGSPITGRQERAAKEIRRRMETSKQKSEIIKAVINIEDKLPTVYSPELREYVTPRIAEDAKKLKAIPVETIKQQAFIAAQEAKQVPETALYVSQNRYLPASAVQQIKVSTPDLYKILINDGYLAYVKAAKEKEQKAQEAVSTFNKKNIQLADGTYILKSDWRKIPEQYQKIGRKKGFDAMVRAMKADTLISGMEVSFTTRRTYIIETPEGKKEVPAKKWESMTDRQQIKMMLGRQPSMNELWLYQKKKGTTIEQPTVTKDKAKPGLFVSKELADTLGVSPALLATAGGIAVAEPTPFGEIALLIIMGGLAGYAAFRKQVGDKKAKEAKTAYQNFQKATGRVPTIDDIALPQAQLIATKRFEGKPIEEQLKSFEVSKVSESIIPPEVKLPVEYIIPPTMEWKMEQVIPKDYVMPMEQVKPTQRDRKQLTIASQQVAEAETELETIIIRGKILETAEIGKYLPSKVAKTETALIALDKAVVEAYTKGEIDGKTLKDYDSARKNYLAKRKQITASIVSYAGNLQIPGASPRQMKDYTKGIIASGAIPLGGTQREIIEALEQGLKKKLGSKMPKISPYSKEDYTNYKNRWITRLQEVAAYDAKGKRKVEKIIGNMENSLKQIPSGKSIKAVNRPYINALALQFLTVASVILLRNGINNATATYAQTLAETNSETKAATKAEAAISEAIQTNTETAIKTATQPLTKSSINIQTTTAIRTAVQNATKQLIKPLTRIATNAIPSTATRTLTKTATSTATTAATTATPATTTAAAVSWLWVPPLPSRSDKEKRKAIKAAKGAIAWRQGELKGKDVWQCGIYPYDSKEYWFTVLGRKPKNATIVKGPRSAYQTIKLLSGSPPTKKVTGDFGFMDFFIRPKGQKSISIGFKPDPEQETTGDINIGSPFPLTGKQPALAGRGNVNRITPKTPKLRR